MCANHINTCWGYEDYIDWAHSTTTQSNIIEGWVCLGRIESKTGRHKIQGKEFFIRSPLVQDGYMLGLWLGERDHLHILS